MEYLRKIESDKSFPPNRFMNNISQRMYSLEEKCEDMDKFIKEHPSYDYDYVSITIKKIKCYVTAIHREQLHRIADHVDEDSPIFIEIDYAKYDFDPQDRFEDVL